MLNQVYRKSRVRKALRNKFRVSDNTLSILLRNEHGLKSETREELIELVKKKFPWMIGTTIK